MSLFGPAWLTVHITTISTVVSVMILVIYSRFVNEKMVFPLSDSIKATIATFFFKKQVSSSVSDMIGACCSTFFFIVFCFFGSVLLSDYVVQPLLVSLRDVLLIIVIVLFVILAKVLHNKRLRQRLF
jgi:hypothetical protein